MTQTLRKFWVASFTIALGLGGGPAFAQQGSIIFECSSNVEGYHFSMKVIETSAGQLETYLVGPGGPGPIPTRFQMLSLDEAVRVFGVVEIAIDALKLRAADVRAEVDTVLIYTAESSPGAFDDDATGVRGVTFLKKSREIFGKGMAYGWAGPMKCEK